MAAPAKSFHEPVESNDPRNVVLDLVEMSIRQALALDPALEHPLRARLTRLLPEPPKPAPEPSGDLWEASVVLTALVECRKRVTSPASAKLIETALGFARARFEALKDQQP